MKYTDKHNIALPLKVWLLNDDYDYNDDPNVISATTLLKPIKQIVLSSRVNREDGEMDISGLVPSRMGTAIHDSIEKAWKAPHKALEALGYPKTMLDKVKINPSPEELVGGCIPVYMEQRIHKKVDKWTISGKYDFIFDGLLMDYKTTSAITYMKQSNTDKYRMQGSIYRWIKPELFKEDYMTIQFIFTDWSSIKAKQDTDYPKSRLVSQIIELTPIQEINQYIKNKLRSIEKYMDEDQDNIPPCTDDELWVEPARYAYYKNPNGVRATKVFDTYYEAHSKLVSDGSVGTVVERKSEVKACRYCSASGICNQAKRYITEGRLVL